jgi:hypothetical protein
MSVWVSKPLRKAMQPCCHRCPVNADKVVEIYQIGNDIWVITKESEEAQLKGYKTWICNRDADTWKIRMEYVN